MIPVQGGFDGCSPANDYTTDTTELMGFLVNSSTASGSVSYKKAVDTLQNPDDININLLCIPGVSLNNESSIYTHAKNMCEDRGDVLFVLDTGREDMTITNAAASTDSVDSSYMAVYYPWVKIADSNTNKLI